MKVLLTLVLVVLLPVLACFSQDKAKQEIAKEKKVREFKEKAAEYLAEVRAGAKLMDRSLTTAVAVAKRRELKELYAHLPDIPPDFDKSVNMAVLLGSFDDDGFERSVILVTARSDALRIKTVAASKTVARQCDEAVDSADRQLAILRDSILDRVRLGQAVLDGDREIVATYVKREKERQAAEAATDAAEEAERKQRELETSGAKAYDAFPVGQRPQLIRDYNKELDRLKEFVRVSEINLAAAKSDKDRESRASVRARALENLAKHERNKPPFITPERAKQFKIKR